MEQPAKERAAGPATAPATVVAEPATKASGSAAAGSGPTKAAASDSIAMMAAQRNAQYEGRSTTQPLRNFDELWFALPFGAYVFGGLYRWPLNAA